MANIYGIELKNVNNFIGHEGNIFQGNVYLNGKKVGFYSEDAWGGEGRLDATKENRKKILDTIEKYYNDNPPLDVFAVYDNISADEFVNMRDNGTLPKGRSKYFNSIDSFMYELYMLKNYETQFKKCIKQGSKALVIVEYIHIKNTPLPYPHDVMWYSPGGKRSLDIIQKKANQKSVANIMKVFSSVNDFIIKED